MTMISLTRRVRTILWWMLCPAHLMTVFLFHLLLCVFQISYNMFSYDNDYSLSEIIQQLVSNPSVVPHYSWDGASLRYKGRLVIPQNTALQQAIFYELHASPSAEHSSFLKTYERARPNFFWQGMTRKIQQMVVEGDTCQCNKGANNTPSGIARALSHTSPDMDRYLYGFH